MPITVAFLKRIQIEEQALSNAFGEQYSDYRKISWALFPWIY
jgi:protein-S-isoprenylcysteine O-methyltransferase